MQPLRLFVGLIAADCLHHKEVTDTSDAGALLNATRSQTTDELASTQLAEIHTNTPPADAKTLPVAKRQDDQLWPFAKPRH